MPFNSSSIWYETSSTSTVITSEISTRSSESTTYSDAESTFDLVTPSSTALSGYSTSTPSTLSSTAGGATLSALDQTLTSLDFQTSTSASLTYTSSIEGSSQDSSLSNFITALSSSVISTSSTSSSSSSSPSTVTSETSFSQASTPLVAPYYSSIFSNNTLISSHQTSSSSSQRSRSSSNIPSSISTVVLLSSPTSELYSSTFSADSSSSISQTSEGGYSVSQNAQSVYYIYTQIYQITGSTTTFNTGILSTVQLAKSASTSFSVPQTTSTKDIQFYQNWLDGGLGHSGAQSPNATKNKIIGGVVGGVGGLIVCSLIIWLMFSRRRKSKNKENTSFSSEIGRRAAYPLPSPSPDANEEKVITQDNGTGAILSKIKSKAKAFPQISRNIKDPREDNNVDHNPFQNEFNFEARLPPPVPPPRKATMQYPIPVGEATSQTDGRYSYVSSMTDSSFASSAGDYSTLSSTSTSIRLGSGYNNNNDVPGGSQGFLREVI